MTDIEKEKDEFDQEIDELPQTETRIIQETEDGVTVSVGESLYRQQKDDPEPRDVIAMRIAK